MKVDRELKRIFKLGGSLVVCIPKKYAEAHGLKPGDRLEMFFDEYLHAKPVNKRDLEEKLEEVKKILEE